MTNLVVEIGNTALKAAWVEGVTLGKTYRYQGENPLDFVVSLTDVQKPSVLVVSSLEEVGQAGRERLASRCAELVVLDAVDREALRGLPLPWHISPDRAAAIVAARYLFEGKGLILFDFGTTISIDVVEPDGEYVGGNISPGLMTRLQSLRRCAKSLPTVGIPANERQTGDSLKTSVESGVVSGIKFEIEGYLSLFPEKIAVFTGGDALYFAKRMKNSIFAVPNLVLMGLAIIADKYVEKSAS